jgi:hypothetical protein
MTEICGKERRLVHSYDSTLKLWWGFFMSSQSTL